METNKNCSYIKCANRVGLFLAVLFVICFVWYYINPAERELHQSLLKLTYIGFSGMNAVSFVLGALQTYVWGYIIVGIWKYVGCCLK